MSLTVVPRVSGRGITWSKGIRCPSYGGCVRAAQTVAPFTLGSGVLFAEFGSTISRRRPTRDLPRFISWGLDLYPGILGSMNSLRNSWSAARVVNSSSSLTVSLSVMSFILHPGFRKLPYLAIHDVHNPTDHGLGRKHEGGDRSRILQSRASYL